MRLHRVSGQLIAQGCRGGEKTLALRIRVRIRSVQPLRDLREVLLRRGERGPGAQPAEHGEPARRPRLRPPRPIAERAGDAGHEHVVDPRVLRHGRQHSDDLVDLVVHGEGLAHDLRIAAVRALPVLVRQDEDGGSALHVVVRHERPAEQRADAESVEEVRRDHGGGDALRLGAAQQRELHLVVLDHRVESAGLLPVILHLERREAGVLHPASLQWLEQVDHPVSVGVRQRPQ